eukprot:scaffold601727_cov20-Prasinocladus_malaysianus.AAC.1
MQFKQHESNIGIQQATGSCQDSPAGRDVDSEALFSCQQSPPILPLFIQASSRPLGKVQQLEEAFAFVTA